jgi:hypothetical protein
MKLAFAKIVSCALAKENARADVSVVRTSATRALQRLTLLGSTLATAGLSACSGAGSTAVAPVAASRQPSSLGLVSGVGSLLASPAAATVTDTPFASDALADSIGLDTHISEMYGSLDFPIVVALVKTLGVRHVRDGVINGNPAYDTAVATLLGSTAKLDAVTNCAGLTTTPTTPADVAAFNTAIGNRIEAVESPNEADDTGDANWVADETACLPGLRAAIAGVPLVAPSLANPNADASQLGNISSLVDIGNIHRYYGGHNPGSAGWGGTFGCGTYGALAWAVCLAQVNSGSKPVAITETGYNTQSEVDEATQAKYLSRALLVDLQGGVAHTFLYVLKDYTGDGYGGDGLVRADDTPKPAFAAIRNELAYFSDKGGSPNLSQLSYTLANGSLDHLLFRKRDGSYVLALWNETSSWNTTTQTPNVVAPQVQTVTFAATPGSVSAVAISDTGMLTPSPVTAVGNALSLAIDDHVTLLHFTLP